MTPTELMEPKFISVGTLLVDLLGVFAGAALGALQAERRKMDLMGFLVLGLVSGIGGGVIRDTLLQAGPPLALVRPGYLSSALVGALAAFLLDFKKGRGLRVLALLDALALGAFAVAGTTRTLEVGLPAGTAILIGVITAVGGGIVRDVLSRNTPMLLRAVPGYYATAALAASAVCLAFSLAGHPKLALAGGMLVGTSLRLLSLRFGWRLPVKRSRSRIPGSEE